MPLIFRLLMLESCHKIFIQNHMLIFKGIAALLFFHNFSKFELEI